MGILKADRITGLGGADAITGSCFFDVKSYLKVYENFTLNGDFTIEWWTHREKGVTDSDWFTIGDAKLDTGLEVYIGSSGSALNVYSNNGTILAANSGSPSQEKWHHMALVRSSGTIKIYVDGTADSTTVSNSSIFNGFLHLGGEFYNGSLTVRSKMHMSNFRIVRKTALYTSNFTPPDRRLEVIPETAILCCQSSSDVTEEATGKKFYAERADNAGSSSNVQASRFTPNSPVGFSTTSDVGSQYGATFDGFGNFATSTYMVPPAGNTRERNRGRGVLGGGVPTYPSGMINSMMFVEIQSQGNAQDFGDLTVARGYHVAGQNSSSTRGLSSSGWTGSGINTIDFITIASTADAIDFGDTSVVRMSGGLSNQTRGLHAGTVSPFSDVIDFVTIATTGNAQDFGDLLTPQSLFAGASSSTRGVFAGGRNNTPSSNTLYNTMQYVTIATTGNAQNFGELQAVRYGHTGFSSPTRGIFAGGYLTPGQTTSIDFFTIATLGNSEDFGDLSTASGYGGSVTNSIRGIITCGDAPNYYNILEFITITTTGNASDFGDTDPSGSGKGQGDFPSCISDSHGGVL